LPESRHKYLYERLGDHDFQQLAAALLAAQFPDFVPMALRQADGGRDGLRKTEPGKVLIYQVKWSVSGKEKDPVTWLDAVVGKEAANLRRLAREGVRRYMLVTNVPSTGKPGTGTYDRLSRKLEEHAKAFGFEEISCVWREALNAWVDNAPDGTKWAYAEMLAGWDLIRYLVAEHAGAARDKGLRDLVRKVASAQWEEDERVKFSQSEVDREKVADLFVDVTADRIRAVVPAGRYSPPVTAVGGAAEYLLGSAAPFTLVRGAPGQGKSTLSQYVCQVHRSWFVPASARPQSLPAIVKPRFPLRFDLSEYARWLGGVDVWDPAEDSKRSKKTRRPGNQATIECFLADLMTHEGGGAVVTANDVQDLFARVPSLVVLDGLDEVGSPAIRTRVVQAIDKFTGRGKVYDDPPKVVVTTRPSGGELAEPSPELFEVLALNPLTLGQRGDYLRKWCAVRGIHGKDGRELRTGFKDKSREPYIGELAGNPMQLTILLDLLHRHGAATPTQRTDLYDQYVDLLLAREANKHPQVVRKYKEELLEIVPFLGWYLHAHTEESQINGRMSVADLQEAMRHFQRAYGNPESVVDELFEGITDRLWALVSKIDGTYEFEILSLREYFAARFLYRNAGEDNPAFDSTRVLRELLRRPYWLNTARFYGGNAKGNGIYVLAAGIEDELADDSASAAFLAAWALLTDGVFLRRPREARRVLTALCADNGLAILLRALEDRDIRALPAFPDLPDTDGPDPTWTRLTSEITMDPYAAENTQRVQALRELLNQRSPFAAWWTRQLTEAIGTPRQNAWLKLAADCEAAAGATPDLSHIDLTDGAAELLLNTGIVPPPGSDLEADLLQAVLNGECPRVTSIRSFPAQVAVALAPDSFLTASATGFSDGDDRTRRSDAVSQLRKASSPFAEVARNRTFKAGQKGSTFPWANTATSLVQHAGRCWLASEIAIIGAASPLALGYTKAPGSPAFGPVGHPSELLAQTRTHATDATWWRQQKAAAGDDELGNAEWALALWSVASGEVIDELLPEWEHVLDTMPPPRRRTVLKEAGRIARHGWLNKRPVTASAASSEISELIASRTTAPATPRPQTRHPDPSSQPGGPTPGKTTAQPDPGPPAQSSLLKQARADNWLKVDSLPVYR
jgi:hypothetical protein